MRRNDHDVTDRVRTTDAAAVSAEVLHLFHGLYPRAAGGPIRRAFDHVLRLYRGRHPAFHACDTQFHDTQHMLEVTLAMARLMESGVQVRAVDRSHFPSSTALPTNESISSKRCALRPWQEALAEYVADEWTA